MYGDDILLCCCANPHFYHTFLDILKLFKLIVNLNFKVSKYEIFFPRKVWRDVCDCFRIQKGKFSFKYLGILIAPKRISKTEFKSLVRLVMDRLGHWQGSLLSQTGRVVLINSTLNSIPLHSSSVT